MMKKWRALFLSILLVGCNVVIWNLPANAWSAQSGNGTDAASWTNEGILFMDWDIVTASKFSEKMNVAPSIMTVITREDIMKNHARDMIDVLNMIPGMNVGQDCRQVGALIVRGLYGFEGRALFMLDGLTLNEHSFGSYVLGNDFPIHLIEKIEIVRGPGSVVYGGAAELAVINIITSKGAEVGGGELSVRYGALPTVYGHRDIGIRFGNKSGEMEYSFLGFTGEAIRSDGDYSYFDYRPTFAGTEKTSRNSDKSLAFSAEFLNNTRIKGYYQDFYNREVDEYESDLDISSEALDVLNAAHTYYTHFLSYSMDISKKLEFSEQFNVTPSLGYIYNEPWDETGRNDIAITRVTPSLTSNWFIMNKIRFFGGFETYLDHTEVIEESGVAIMDSDYLRKSLTGPPVKSVNINSYAVYSSLNADFNLFHYVAGLRYDKNELYGQQLSPRLGLTYEQGGFFSKLLYSAAFRAPLYANNVQVRAGFDPAKPWRSEVKAESTRVFELEVGKEVTRNLFGTINIFHQTVNNIIEYRWQPDYEDVYSDNGGKIGTDGLETEWKFKKDRYQGLLNVSYLTPKLYADPTNEFAYAANPQGGDTYLAIHAPDELLGVPTVKVYTNHYYDITKKLSVQANLLYLTAKNAMSGWGETITIAPQTIIGIGMIYKSILKGMDVSFSAHDIFNRRLKLVVPYYDSGQDILNYKGREISVDVRYIF